MNRILSLDKPLSEKNYWKIKNSLTHRIEILILADTSISKMIPPTEIWQALYEYISSLRDKPFADTRTDAQKLESAGFNKKTSFRNIK